MKDIRSRVSTAFRSPTPAPDAVTEATRLVNAALGATRDLQRWPKPPLASQPAVEALLDSGPETHLAAMDLLVADFFDGPRGGFDNVDVDLFALLVTRHPPVPAAMLIRHMDRLRVGVEEDMFARDLVRPMARLARDRYPSLAPAERAALADVVAGVIVAATARSQDAPPAAAIAMLRTLVPSPLLDLGAMPVETVVGRGMQAVVEASTGSPQALGPLVAHLVRGTSKARPDAPWLERTRSLTRPLAEGPALIRAMITVPLEAPESDMDYDGYRYVAFVQPAEEKLVRSCIWAAAALGDVEAIPLLRGLALKGVEMIGGQYGKPRSMGMALACPAAIATIGGPAALAALQQLQRSTRHGSLLRETSKAIDSLAAAGGMTAGELLETSVETHGLGVDGTRTIAVGDARATITLDASGEVTVTWTTAAGKQVASLPRATRDAQPDAVAEVTATAKAFRSTVTAERIRLDGLFVQARSWSVGTWRERYLDHPVTGTLSRGLIWRFRTGDAVRDGMPVDGTTATDTAGLPFPIDPDASVELWHPVLATTAEVQAWRTRLLTEGRRQALKQAFREIYLVTPAELATATYSNRFASHIIRQVQARALMKGRGWKPLALAWWDDGIDHGVARRTYDAYRIQAQFFYDPILVDPVGELYPWVSTDQVAFFDTTTDQRIRVADVPALLFSEVMRDVDLFVGVTSIGADPQWLDNGERRFDAYWHRWGFGDLEQAGRIRRDVLAAMLPGLVIADRCRLDERWLEVRGDLHTYRIHLGSGNILMSPDDRYLCIVASRSSKPDPRVHLPFDDDPVLSLILSKAFLLARDTAITDESIVAQIRG